MKHGKTARVLLSPLTGLFGLIVSVRNGLYDRKIWKSYQFDFPVIAVGNLSFGGTGKTPHIEYLIRLISDKYKTAVLSRGYKRKTSGYLVVEGNAPSKLVGDEPAQVKRKHPHVTVAVSENRLMAIPNIVGDHHGTEVILMDDGMQHRQVEPSMLIMLTAYNDLFTRDELLPSGSLREHKSGYKRADIIVVTKCPVNLSEEDRALLRKEINPQPDQLLVFSYLEYGQPYNLLDPRQKLLLNNKLHVLLFCGIANTKPLEDYLEHKVANHYMRSFPDHYFYERRDMETLTNAFNNIREEHKIIMTTEKDAVRLEGHLPWIVEKKLPIFVQPVQVGFFEEDRTLFNQEILGYLERVIGPRDQQVNYIYNG